MAIPLVIFAAAVCRFVRENGCKPKRQLSTIMDYQTPNKNKVSKFDSIYLPILNQLFGKQNDKDEAEKAKVAGEFVKVVGTIAVLAKPLSINSPARRLSIEAVDITCKLDLMHSILNVPPSNNRHVRLLHFYFGDFPLDPLKRRNSLFYRD